MSAAGQKIEGLAEAALQFFFGADNITLAKIEGIERKITALVHNFHVESLRVRNFKFDPHWKSRVISIPKSIQNIKDLFEQIREVFDDKGQTVAAPFKEFAHTLKLLAQTDDTIDPQGGPSKIATAFSKLQEFVTELNTLIGAIDAALDEVKGWGELFDRILEDLQSLEDLFLSQKAPREKQTLTYYKRVR